MLKASNRALLPLDAFIAKQETFIRDQVAKANCGPVTIAGGRKQPRSRPLHREHAPAAAVVASAEQAGGNSGGVAAGSPRASRSTPT